MNLIGEDIVFSKLYLFKAMCFFLFSATTLSWSLFFSQKCFTNIFADFLQISIAS